MSYEIELRRRAEKDLPLFRNQMLKKSQMQFLLWEMVLQEHKETNES